MTRRQKQSLFSGLYAELVLWAIEQGYEVTFGRGSASAKANAADGGISGSNHTKRLAQDLNLFKDGKYLRSTESHRLIGEHWESMHPLCRWGGRFKGRDGKPKPDGNHYSLADGGKA